MASSPRCAASSASGSAPAIWYSGRDNSPPDPRDGIFQGAGFYFDDWAAAACEFPRRIRRSRRMPASSPPLAELAPGLSAAGALARDDIEALSRAGVRTIINNRPDGEDPGQLPAAEARALAEAQGLAYHHIPITAARLSRADVDALDAVLATAEQPVVAHCRSGT